MVPDQRAADSSISDPDASRGRLQRILAWLSRRKSVAKARRFVDEHPHMVSSTFFVGGFLLDSATLTRVDALFDNLLLLTYVIVISVLGYFALVRRAGQPLPKWLRSSERWLPLAMQFGFGALFSANVIFYWQSTSLTTGAVYFVLLVTLLVANEFVSHDRSPIILFGLLFIASHSFFMFLVPVVLAAMGFGPFLLAGLMGVGLCVTIWTLLNRRSALPTRMSRIGSLVSVGVLFIASNVFYLNRWIPPVPMAVRDIGVYHSVEREGARFALSYEPSNALFRGNRPSKLFRRGPDEPVYCFVSVFAPRRFKDEIYHSWYFKGSSGEWEKRDRIGYQVEGGRQSGFRGYTFKRNVEPGEWRIDVETETEVVVGRLYFTVVAAADTNHQLRVRFK